jgi:hypothetical protein
MAGFKEINNLGVEISNQFALYDQIREQSLLDNASQVRIQTQVDTSRPILVSNSAELFGLEKRNLPFGEILPPPNYYSSQNRAFVYNLIPSIGDSDKLVEIHAAIETKKAEFQSNGQETEHEEASSLSEFTQMLYGLEKDFNKIENERVRLQKG